MLAALSLGTINALATSTNGTPLRATPLLGMRVENPDGREVGSLRDLAVNANTGQLEYVIVASGGFFGAGTQLRAIPPQRMSAATSKRDTLALDIFQVDWEKAPVFKRSDLPYLAQSQHAKTIAQFYQTAKSKSQPAPELQLEKTISQSAATNRLNLTSDIIGARVEDRDREMVGEIVDLLFAFEQRSPVFALISARSTTAKIVGRTPQHYAIPLNSLRNTGKDTFLFASDRKNLDSAPKFGTDAWMAMATPAAGAPRIYQFDFGTRPKKRWRSNDHSRAVVPINSSGTNVAAPAHDAEQNRSGQ